MNKSTVTHGCKKGPSTLIRATFSPGMLLQHEDLQQVNAYTRDLSRLLFKSLFGCGVVCGLKVQATSDCDQLKVTIQPGVALACSGDPVHVPQPVIVWVKGPLDPQLDTLWVVLRRWVKHCVPRSSHCCDDDDAPSACTRERDGFEIQVVSPRPECVCGCPDADANVDPTENSCRCANSELKCYEDHYAGRCGFQGDDCDDCECKSIILARLDKPKNPGEHWKTEYRVRRFVRPVLMRDPETIVKEKSEARPPRDQPRTRDSEVENERRVRTAAEPIHAAETLPHSLREYLRTAVEVGESAQTGFSIEETEPPVWYEESQAADEDAETTDKQPPERPGRRPSRSTKKASKRPRG